MKVAWVGEGWVGKQVYVGEWVSVLLGSRMAG
jgi:hypothetical protein